MGWEAARALASVQKQEAQDAEIRWVFEKAEIYGFIILDPDDPDDLADLLETLRRRRK